MSEINESLRFNLATVPSDISTAIEKLGKNASGAALLQNIISAEDLEALGQEVASIPTEDLRDVHNVKTNKRGAKVPQNYWAYALRTDRGDQTRVDQLPLLKELSHSLTHLITTDIAKPYARLKQWAPTEQAVHKYSKEGLGFHFDPVRYWGVIAIANLQGEREFHVRENGQLLSIFSTAPGDVILMRGANLYSSSDSAIYLPEHSVQNVGDDGGTSFMIRASSEPDKIYDDFKYVNWPEE